MMAVLPPSRKKDFRDGRSNRGGFASDKVTADDRHHEINQTVIRDC